MDAIDVCASYTPKLGHGGKGYSSAEFQSFYAEDLFYSWIGLNSPLVYAAHRAAGGITSVYRQIGIACERLFRRILADSLGLTEEDSIWSYTLPADEAGRRRRLTFDARIPLDAIRDPERRRIVAEWMVEAGKRIGLEQANVQGKLGAVFEIRQGYKSKDSKRQNADISNAANAYAYQYLPVIAVFSSQMDDNVAKRYRASRILVLLGSKGGRWCPRHTRSARKS